MNFSNFEIKGPCLIEPKVFEDHRGYFFESFKQEVLDDYLGYKVRFIQDNESKSNKGVLRGLHYQMPPHTQSKYIRVVSGSVIDVIVDIRQGSPTFGQHLQIELSAANKKQLFVPRGFAHAFLVLEDDTIFSYKVDAVYAPDCDRGIYFADPALGIQWPLETEECLLSEKDKGLPCLKECTALFDYSVDYYA